MHDAERLIRKRGRLHAALSFNLEDELLPLFRDARTVTNTFVDETLFFYVREKGAAQPSEHQAFAFGPLNEPSFVPIDPVGGQRFFSVVSLKDLHMDMQQPLLVTLKNFGSLGKPEDRAASTRNIMFAEFEIPSIETLAKAESNNGITMTYLSPDSGRAWTCVKRPGTEIDAGYFIWFWAERRLQWVMYVSEASLFYMQVQHAKKVDEASYMKDDVLQKMVDEGKLNSQSLLAIYTRKLQRALQFNVWKGPD